MLLRMSEIVSKVRDWIPKPKIGNRILRWLAAFPICVIAVAAMAVVAIVVLYGVGLLAYGFYSEPYDSFLNVVSWGALASACILMSVIILGMVVSGIDWIGNQLFDSAAEKVEKTAAP